MNTLVSNHGAFEIRQFFRRKNRQSKSREETASNSRTFAGLLFEGDLNSVTGQWLSSRRGSPVVLRVELFDGLLNEGGAVAFDFERDIALLPVAKLLHLPAELDFLNRESAKLIKNGTRFCCHVVNEDTTE